MTNLKTVVVFRWTKNPQDAIVKADGSVNWAGVKMAPTDDDPAAMKIAKTLSNEEDIIGLTIGEGKTDWAAARGAASTMVIEDVHSRANGAKAAEVIAEAIKRAGNVDVVTIGDSDWDRAVVSALVGKLGWKAYAGVIAAEKKDDALLITVKSPEGSRIIQTDTPVLLATLALCQEENVPGMKQTLAARKKPIEKLHAADIGVSTDDTAESMGTRLPEGNSVVLFDGEDPEAAVGQLLDALRGEGVL